MSYQSDNMAFNNAMDSLSHHGVLGMKWGVRNAETLRKYGQGSGTYAGISDRRRRKLADSYRKMDADKMASHRNNFVDQYEKKESRRTENQNSREKTRQSVEPKLNKLSKKIVRQEMKARTIEGRAYRKLRKDAGDEKAIKRLSKVSKIDKKIAKEKRKQYSLEEKLRKYDINDDRLKIDMYRYATNVAIADEVARERGASFLKEYSKLTIPADNRFDYENIDKLRRA